MEKCQSPKLNDVGSNPASSAELQKEAKVVCNSVHCKLESCRHYYPHEKVNIMDAIIGNYRCVESQFCSSVGIKVRCEKVVDN